MQRNHISSFKAINIRETRMQSRMDNIETRATLAKQIINTTQTNQKDEQHDPTIKQRVSLGLIYLRNNSWKPYVYIVFTTVRPLCHEVLKS